MKRLDTGTVPSTLIVTPADLTPADPFADADARAAVRAAAPVADNAIANFFANSAATELGQPRTEKPQGGVPQLPFLGFYHGRSKHAADIVSALGPVGDGTPYYSDGPSYYAASGWTYQILDWFQYWATLTQGDWQLAEVSTTPKEGKSPSGLAWKENIMSICLLLPGVQPLPEAIGPAAATLTTWRSTKAPACKGAVDAAEYAGTSEWAKASPANGGVAANVPQNYRVCSALKIETRTARSGFTYETASAVSATVGIDQLEALKAWGSSEDHQATLVKVREGFERRKAELEAKAAETLAAGAAS